MTEPGDLLGTSFRVREVLTGGMGQIFICDWESQGRDAPVPVALKTFQRRYFFESSARLSFVREASTWLRLSHLPHIMPVILIEHIDDQPYIVMPAVPPGPAGERSIADLLERGPLDPASALAFAFQVALGLHRAAGLIDGLVHGDLKPANVLLLNGDAFLSDFGLVSAVSLGPADVRLRGTPEYQAPELRRVETARGPSVGADTSALRVLLFEMLVGRSPPEVPADFPATGLPAASMAVALACLAQDPAERPRDFHDVLARIHAVYEEYDPAGLLMLMMRASEVGDAMHAQARDMRLLRIRGLLSLDEPRQALEELDAIPPDEYDALLWLERGIALSLLGRAEEAIEALEHALDGDLSDGERTSALSEYALALKRLDRFDDARSIYEQLMGTVSDEALPLVVINLATVHLEEGKGDDAVRLLEPFVRQRPELPEAWSNLGQGYAMVGRYDDAVAAYGRGLGLAPHDGRIRVQLAAVYMDHLGRVPEAWTALDAAFDSGHESREWFVRMLASSLLLDRKDTVDGMLWAAKNNMPEDLAESLLEEGVEMARSLAGQYSNVEKPAEALTEEPVETATEKLADADPPPAPAEPAEEAARPGIPFLNFRFYDFFDFTIDYYQRADAEQFVPVFLQELRRAMRDPNMVAPLRGSAFYFTRCPSCSVQVLTNRDIGKHITCRMCETGWHTEPLSEPALNAIVAEVSAALGVEQTEDPGAAEVHVLFVQPPETAPPGLVGEVCGGFGMAELEPNRLMSIHMVREARARGLAKLGQAYSVWTLTAPKPAAWARDTTSPAIAEVVRELQQRTAGVLTLSTTVTVDDMAAMDETVEEVEAAAERALRERVRAGEAQAGDLRWLAKILVHRGDYDAGERIARAAIAADEGSAEGWQTLGTALFRRDDFAGSRDALEQSLAHDPTSVLVMMMLARCYDELGDQERADELYARAESSTAGEFGA
jgi:tetratricopeptide (TPR) repeat protein